MTNESAAWQHRWPIPAHYQVRKNVVMSMQYYETVFDRLLPPRHVTENWTSLLCDGLHAKSVEMQSQHQHQDSPLSSPGNVSLTLQHRNMDTSVGRCGHWMHSMWNVSDRYLTSNGGNISLTQTCFRDQVFHSLVTSFLIVASPCSVTLPAWTQVCRQMLPFSWWWTVMRARSHQPPGRGPLVTHTARGSTTSKTLMLGRCRQYGDPRLLEVTEERNGPSGLCNDDDEYYEK